MCLHMLVDRLLTAYDAHQSKGKGTVGIKKVFIDIIKQERLNTARLKYDELIPDKYEKHKLTSPQAAEAVSRFVDDFQEDDEIISMIYNFIGDNFVTFHE